jgi:uncharacterized protein Smg (DUF494 family)
MRIPIPDRESIQTELLAAGFPVAGDPTGVRMVGQLGRPSGDRRCRSTPVPAAFTSAPELAKLDVECQGFLLFLEQSGVLGSETRELVIDRVMALEADDIGLHQLKWIVLDAAVQPTRSGRSLRLAWKIWCSTKPTRLPSLSAQSATRSSDARRRMLEFSAPPIGSWREHRLLGPEFDPAPPLHQSPASDLS